MAYQLPSIQRILSFWMRVVHVLVARQVLLLHRYEEKKKQKGNIYSNSIFHDLSVVFFFRWISFNLPVPPGERI